MNDAAIDSEVLKLHVLGMFWHWKTYIGLNIFV